MMLSIRCFCAIELKRHTFFHSSAFDIEGWDAPDVGVAGSGEGLWANNIVRGKNQVVSLSVFDVAGQGEVLASLDTHYICCR